MASGPDEWGLRATVVGKATLKVQIEVEAEGNLNGSIKRRCRKLKLHKKQQRESIGVMRLQAVDLH